MSQNQIEQKLSEYISSHPDASYEEWIGAIHPEAKEKCLLEGLGGEILIDQEYYAEESEHRNLWNVHADQKRTKVPASPVGSESSDDVEIVDLLGNKERIISPAASPSRKVSPEEDLMSFD